MQSPIVNRVDTIFVHVKNLERSVRWYCDLFGLPFKEGNYGGPIYTFHMGAGRPGLTFDNHCLDRHYEFTPSNQPLFNLSTTDIHAAYEHVKKMGAEIVTEIETFPDLADFLLKILMAISSWRVRVLQIMSEGGEQSLLSVLPLITI